MPLPTPFRLGPRLGLSPTACPEQFPGGKFSIFPSPKKGGGCEGEGVWFCMFSHKPNTLTLTELPLWGRANYENPRGGFTIFWGGRSPCLPCLLCLPPPPSAFSNPSLASSQSICPCPSSPTPLLLAFLPSFRPIPSSIPLPVTSACPNFSLLLFFFVPPPFPLAGREEVVVVVVGRDGLRTTVPDVPSSEMTCRQTTESSVSFQGFRNILLMYRHEQARLRVVAIFRSIVSCTVPLG